MYFEFEKNGFWKREPVLALDKNTVILKLRDKNCDASPSWIAESDVVLVLSEG